tara:strand:- start:349 stop:579 length:231 start_codon:yes stop_codon:yes gene_type:complete
MKQACLILLFFFSLISDLYAYLDPGTGSIILQYLVAGLVTTIAIFKSSWFKIKDIFKKIINKIKGKKDLKDLNSND